MAEQAQWCAYRERSPDDGPITRGTWAAARDALVSYLIEAYRDDTCGHCLAQCVEAVAELQALTSGDVWEGMVDGEDLSLCWEVAP
jgi:hypothetical protein